MLINNPTKILKKSTRIRENLAKLSSQKSNMVIHAKNPGGKRVRVYGHMTAQLDFVARALPNQRTTQFFYPGDAIQQN